VFPAGWVLGLLALCPSWRRGLLKLANPAGIALFALITAPWFLLMERRHPGFLHFFFVEQHFQRFLTQKYNRASPWYFFLLVLPAGLLPWTPAALAALLRPWSHWKADPRDLALLLWAGLVTAFFSTSQSKLATYILPVFPQLALLTASALQRPLPAWSKRLSWVLGAVLRTDSDPLAVLLKPFAFAAALALGAGLTGLGFSRRDSVKRLATVGLAVGALALGAISAGSEHLSAKSLGLSIAGRAAPEDRVWAYGIYIHGVPFYAARRVDRLLNWIGELHYAKRDASFADRFGDESDLGALPPEKGRVFLTFRRLDSSLIFSVTGDPERGKTMFGPWVLAVY
jgi:hypothetical protein